ncbi:HD domain-containing phosphohydrolase [Thalassotalea aquiviva]|uniref:HD domain-containing phosphohydrolase n=1 Tax=Thalassotalea aquiviva TaxID=3242415 RepID=UPI00352B51E0
MHLEQKQSVLIVDDNPDNIDLLIALLKPFYQLKAALSGEQALKIAQSAHKPDLILLDIMMPKMDGYEVCRKLKADPVTLDIPVIFITAKTEIEDEHKGLSLGAVDFISKPICAPIVLARVKTHLALYDMQRELERQVHQRTEELEHTRLEIVRCLGRAAEYKDNETGLHVIRMSYYAKFIAQQLGINDAWVDLLFHAAPMHDVGKIGILDKTLLKPGKLDPQEREEMNRHVEYGVEILGKTESDLLQMAKDICLYHHEKYDGSGYPHQLRGKDIPLSARIVSIADVFDALTSNRPYKKSWSVDDAVLYIEQQAGRHFDPDLIEPFRQCLPQMLNIREKYQDNLEEKI